MSSSATNHDTPLYNLLADGGLVDEATAVTAISALVELLRPRPDYALILPENVHVRGATVIISGTTEVSHSGSAFLPPEYGGLEPATIQRDAAAAYVWNLGMILYTLLAGYPPFASTTTSCPWFADYRATQRLACPEHFSSGAIALLLQMATIDPSQRASLQSVALACEELRIKGRLAEHERRKSTSELSLTRRSSSGGSVTARLAAMALRPLSARSLGQSTAQRGVVLPPSSGTSAAVSAVDIGDAAAAAANNMQMSPASSNGSSREASVNASPMIGANAGDGLWARAPITGPHGAPTAAVVSSAMVPHPNSPKIGSAPSEAYPAGGVRPTAVMYSPVSQLPRKLRAGGTLSAVQLLGAAAAKANTALATPANSGGAASGPELSRRCVRRLGWVVRCESAEELLRKVSETLELLHVSYERIIMKTEHSIEHVGAVGLITSPTHVDDSMGHGAMRATIVVTPTQPGAPSAGEGVDKSPRSPARQSPSSPQLAPYRIDVARYTGDTFQFHAFYRSLRESLWGDCASTKAPAMTMNGGSMLPPQPPAHYGNNAPAGGWWFMRKSKEDVSKRASKSKDRAAESMEAESSQAPGGCNGAA